MKNAYLSSSTIGCSKTPWANFLADLSSPFFPPGDEGASDEVSSTDFFISLSFSPSAEIESLESLDRLASRLMDPLSPRDELLEFFSLYSVIELATTIFGGAVFPAVLLSVVGVAGGLVTDFDDLSGPCCKYDDTRLLKRDKPLKTPPSFGDVGDCGKFGLALRIVGSAGVGVAGLKRPFGASSRFVSMVVSEVKDGTAVMDGDAVIAFGEDEGGNSVKGLNASANDEVSRFADPSVGGAVDANDRRFFLFAREPVSDARIVGGTERGLSNGREMSWLGARASVSQSAIISSAALAGSVLGMMLSVCFDADPSAGAVCSSADRGFSERIDALLAGV